MKHPVQKEQHAWLITQMGNANYGVKWTGPQQSFDSVQYDIFHHRGEVSRLLSFIPQTQVTLVTPLLFVLFIFKNRCILLFNVHKYYRLFLDGIATRT